MKTYKIFFIITIVLFTNTIYSQNSVINENDIHINNTIHLGDSVAEVSSILGTPSQINNYYSEIDDETWEEYNFNGNLFYFYGNELIEFELKNDQLYFYNTNLKVGTGISLISNIFSSSYNQRGVSDSTGFITINISLLSGAISDQYVLIQYSPVSSKIISIRTASY